MNMNLVTFLHVIVESGFALLCLLALLSLRLYDTAERKATKVLRACLLMNTLINIADSFAYVYRGDTSHLGYILVRISNFTVFAGMLAAGGCACPFGNRCGGSVYSGIPVGVISAVKQ